MFPGTSLGVKIVSSWNLTCGCFNEWRMTFCSEKPSATSNGLLFAISNKRIFKRVTSYFLQSATSATGKKQIMQRVTSDFLQWATSATSKEQILQRVTCDLTTSNE